MAFTEVQFGRSAQERMLHGVDILANAVKSTLGPKARTVLIRKGFGLPRISNDGVTVAKSIELEDPIEAMGAEVVREAASRNGGRRQPCRRCRPNSERDRSPPNRVSATEHGPEQGPGSAKGEADGSR